MLHQWLRIMEEYGMNQWPFRMKVIAQCSSFIFFVNVHKLIDHKTPEYIDHRTQNIDMGLYNDILSYHKQRETSNKFSEIIPFLHIR